MSCCSTCKEDFRKKDFIVVCNLCNDPFHSTEACAGISPAEVKILNFKNKKPVLVYKCKTCTDNGGKSIQEALLTLTQNVNKMSESISSLAFDVYSVSEDLNIIKGQFSEILNANRKKDVLPNNKYDPKGNGTTSLSENGPVANFFNSVLQNYRDVPGSPISVRASSTKNVINRKSLTQNVNDINGSMHSLSSIKSDNNSKNSNTMIGDFSKILVGNGIKIPPSNKNLDAKGSGPTPLVKDSPVEKFFNSILRK